MPDYRLYRLDGANRIMGPAIVVTEPDDDAAITKAIEIDHAQIIEVWCGGSVCVTCGSKPIAEVAMRAR